MVCEYLNKINIKHKKKVKAGIRRCSSDVENSIMDTRGNSEGGG